MIGHDGLSKVGILESVHIRKGELKGIDSGIKVYLSLLDNLLTIDTELSIQKVILYIIGDLGGSLEVTEIVELFGKELEVESTNLHVIFEILSVVEGVRVIINLSLFF